jgi:hypothetical protein
MLIVPAALAAALLLGAEIPEVGAGALLLLAEAEAPLLPEPDDEQAASASTVLRLITPTLRLRLHRKFLGELPHANVCFKAIDLRGPTKFGAGAPDDLR